MITPLRQGFGGQLAPGAREAMDHLHRAIFVAKDGGILAEFVIVDSKDAVMPEIDWLIVGVEWQGKKVVHRLM
jgi:hypothetical protein